MKNKVAVISVAAGLAGGALAGVALGVPGLAGAQSTTNPSTSSATAPSSGTTTAPAPKVDKQQRLQQALQPLVDDGTITQAQADKVIAALEQALPKGGPGRGPGFGPGFGVKGAGLDAIATAIGVTTDELRTALQGGQTIAQVAQAHGKTAQQVTDALVASAQAKLDAAVKAGTITQAKADEELAEAKERIPQMLNGQLPMGPGHGRGHFGGPTTPASGSTTQG